jgi:AraC-like DNA-binding protein
MNSFKYLIDNERDLKWGLSITDVGFEEISKDEVYPNTSHPVNYNFNIEKGRVLNEYQLVYIIQGEGVLQTRHLNGKAKVKQGSIFLLFPHEWHTYAPCRETGWKAYWIGFKGINIDSRVNEGFLSVSNPIFNVGINDDLIRLFQQAIDVAEREEPYYQQLLAGITNYVIGLMYSLDKIYHLNDSDRLIEKMNSARALMRANLEKEFDVKTVADSLNMSYESFRKIFKRYTGFSPSSFFLNLRIGKAKEWLLTSDMTVKEIAYRLHFDNPDYFTSQFKKKTGYNPSSYRNFIG